MLRGSISQAPEVQNVNQVDYSNAMRASTNDPVSLTHSQQMQSYRSCGPRGIRKEDDGSFMSGDNSLISFKQFFELMKNKTHAKGN